MKKIETKTQRGQAKVFVKGSKMKVVFPEGEPIVADVPSWFPDKFKAGELYVKMGKDGEVQAASPLHGMYTCKFQKFFSFDGAVPEPHPIEARSGTSSKGKPYKIDAHLEFSAIMKILDPLDMAGMTIQSNMFYLFTPDGNETAIKGGGKAFDLLSGFLEATGVENVAIPYSENVLPKLMKAILKAGKTFRVMVENGYVTRFVALLDEDDADDGVGWGDEDGGKPAPKPVASEDETSWGDAEEDDSVSDDDATDDEKEPF